MTERYGGRTTGLIGLGVTFVPLLIAWQFADSFGAFLALGLLLGVAGASFAAALPLASAWYPPEHQGLAMGIAGAGNSGTLLATLFAPRIAQAIGWRPVFGIAMIPVAVVWMLFFFLAKDAPGTRSVKKWSEYSALLKIGDTAWFCFIYMPDLRRLRGLSSYLSIFFHDQYHLTKVQSGDFTTFVVLFGSFLRPVGGMLSDRLGGYRMLVAVLTITCVCLCAVATLPPAFVGSGVSRGCNGNARDGQRIRLPTGTAAISRSRRHHDRHCRRGWGLRRFSFAVYFGIGQTGHRQFRNWRCHLDDCGAWRSCRPLYLKSVWRRTWPASAACRAGLRQAADEPAEVYAASV